MLPGIVACGKFDTRVVFIYCLEECLGQTGLSPLISISVEGQINESHSLLSINLENHEAQLFLFLCTCVYHFGLYSLFRRYVKDLPFFEIKRCAK